MDDICGSKEPYISGEAVELKAEQDRINQEYLRNRVTVNQDGIERELYDLWLGSVSNPDIREYELMTRVRGFTEYADAHGYMGLFITMTLPSRFHANTHEKRNKKFNGTTVQKGQAQLKKWWGRIRSALARMGIFYFGFRAADPHKDGTPHWHLFLYVKKEQTQTVSTVLNIIVLKSIAMNLGQKNIAWS